MKTLLGLIAAIFATALLLSCSQSPIKSYSISGELIVLQSEEPEDTDSDTGEATEPPVYLDSSIVTVSVTYEIMNVAGEVEEVELLFGNFVNGRVEYVGEVDEPTTVKIAVDVGEGDPLTASALIAPGADIKFVLLDHWESYRADQLAMVGSSRMSKNSSKKFSISGDFSSVDEDLSNVVVSASAMKFDDEGQRQVVDLGEVMLVNDTFLFEGDIDEPTRISIYAGPVGSWYASTNFILVEPQSEITLTQRGTAPIFLVLATSGSGMHAKVIESWQQSEDYLSAFDKYYEGYTQYIAEREARRKAASEENRDTDEDGSPDEQVATSSSGDGTSADSGSAESVEGDESATTEEEEKQVAIASAEPVTPAAEGCEHVTLAAEQTGRAANSMGSMPEYYKYRDKMDEIQMSVLKKIATEAEDPFESLLAIELGAFYTSTGVQSDALTEYDKLAVRFEDERIAHRISQARKKVESRLNNERIKPGQKAPEFTLGNLEGTEVALYDLLTNRELLLVDFWASWCGPCIADFPELKKLYGAYSPHGFEIVGVSIDSAFEDWKEGSIEHELPWIDLGEMDGWEGATATSYGVLGIPAGFLLDPNGCILKKNVRPARLKEALIAQFGEVPELTESSEESDSDSTDHGPDEIDG